MTITITKKQHIAQEVPRELQDAKRREIALPGGTAGGICGTGKQHIAQEVPREFQDAKRPEIALPGGTAGGICGTGI